MSLRWKLGLIMAAALISGTLTTYGLSAGILERGFIAIERDQAAADVARARNAIQRELVYMDRMVIDWGSWDDMYSFAATGDPSFVESNVGSGTLAGLELSAVVVLDREGNEVFSRGASSEDEDGGPAPPSLVAASGLLPLPSDGLDALHHSAVTIVDGQPTLVVARAILRTDGSGPATGVLLMARRLDEALIARLAADTLLSLDLRVAGPDDADLSPAQPDRIEAVSGSAMLARGLVETISGPPLVISLELPRPIAEEGRYTRALVTLYMFLTRFAALSVGFLLVDRFVLRPIRRLSSSVREVAAAGDVSARVPAGNRDEVGQLARDINATLAALEEVEMRYSRLIETARDGIIVTDDGGVIEAANPAAGRMLGYSPGELLGQRLAALISFEGDALASGRVAEGTARRKDGSEFPAEVAMNELRLGDSSQLTCVMRDITSRKLAAEAARAAWQQLATLFETLPAGVVVFDAAGNVMQANPAAEALFGLDRTDPVGWGLAGVAYQRHSDDGSPLGPQEHPFARVRATGEPVSNIEYWLDIPGRERKALSVNASPLRDAQGAFAGVIAIYIDETDRKIAMEESQRLNALKDRFVSMVSHEFRTALTGIQGFSELIRDSDFPPEVVQEYAGDIYDDARRLDRMVTELLDIGRIESGRLELHRTRFDLAELTGELAAREGVARARRVDVNRNGPVWVYADRDRVIQALTNLLSNAFKYSPPGEAIVMDVERTDDEAVVAVIDRGAGMTPEEAATLFQRYGRLERHEGAVGGTGLGLVLVREIAQLHGGNAWIESAPGEGTKAYFSLRTS